jgi:hypothetical protein
MGSTISSSFNILVAIGMISCTASLNPLQNSLSEFNLIRIKYLIIMYLQLTCHPNHTSHQRHHHRYTVGDLKYNNR